MAELAQLIVAIATLVTALGAVILGLVNRQTINQVKTQTDGMLSELKATAHGEGVVQGKAEGKADEIQYQRDRTS